mmetsp:Transcript_26479/g.72796  ORF Transcript_26479/g.72796 Transcript_26479/m.72796 type:complete len:103 (+) Transcript_26479:2796-3104(+)
MVLMVYKYWKLMNLVTFIPLYLFESRVSTTILVDSKGSKTSLSFCNVFSLELNTYMLEPPSAAPTHLFNSIYLISLSEKERCAFVTNIISWKVLVTKSHLKR